jgi:hypothetical protein
MHACLLYQPMFMFLLAYRLAEYLGSREMSLSF